MWAKAFAPEIRQRSRTHAARAITRKQHCARNAARSRVGCRRTEIAPPVVQARRGQIAVPAQAQSHHQFPRHAPVVLEEPSKIIELLSDKSRRINLAAIRVSE